MAATYSLARATWHRCVVSFENLIIAKNDRVSERSSLNLESAVGERKVWNWLGLHVTHPRQRRTAIQTA